MKPETLAIHAANAPDPATGAVAPPIHMATTFERAADGSYPRGFNYGRSDNPTRRALEQAIAALEGGAGAACFASGTAASMAVFSLLRPGEHVIAPSDGYHGTLLQLRELVARHNIAVSFVETWRPGAIEAAWTPATRLVWIETPSNPRLWLTDIAATAALAHEHDALLAGDSTFATPVVQRPLLLGADLVMHSSTKYLAGHSDVTGGVVVVREAGVALDAMHAYQGMAGAVPSPFDCWLIRRSMMTVYHRVRAQSATALLLARYLDSHPRVERVYYPGLPSHPGHQLAKRQMDGFGGMLSFDVEGGAAEALAVAARTKLFTRATSLGGVESLIEHRASIEGPATLTPQNLLRVSVGLEHPDDLLEDLRQALG